MLIPVAVARLSIAGTMSEQSGDVQARMAEVLRYTGVENPAPNDLARMTELWTRAQQPGVASDERQRAFRDMYVHYGKLKGRDLADRAQLVDGLARFAVTAPGADGSHTAWAARTETTSWNKCSKILSGRRGAACGLEQQRDLVPNHRNGLRSRPKARRGPPWQARRFAELTFPSRDR
jgi:hypothetical protein